MELYPPQKDLVDKLGTPLLVSRLIGDEMGLGKTIEALAVDKELRKSPRGRHVTLIIAPRATHEMPWASTIRDFLGAKACVIDRKNRSLFLRALEKGDHDFFICHYEAMRLLIRDSADFKEYPFLHVIADECHRLKNRKAQQTLAVKRLKPVYKTAMSGTPADNKPEDLWSTLNWLYPAKFRSYWGFANRYCAFQEQTIVGRGGQQQTVRQIVGANTAAMPELQKILSPFYMRRLKKDVLKDLPDKVYSELHCDLSPQQRRIYDELRSDMIAWIGTHQNEPLSTPIIVAQLIRLQQAALAYLEWGEVNGQQRVILREPSSKLDVLLETLEDEGFKPKSDKTGSGRTWPAFVVFSQSKSMIRLTAKRLRDAGYKVGLFTGDTPDEERAKAVLDFQGGQIDAFCATIAAGGEGITLTRASTVFFLDRSWSPSKNLQAEDRLHRVGQKNAVQVIDIVARDTVDQRVRDANIRKWAGIRAILGDSR